MILLTVIQNMQMIIQESVLLLHHAHMVLSLITQPMTVFNIAQITPMAIQQLDIVKLNVHPHTSEIMG